MIRTEKNHIIHNKELLREVLDREFPIKKKHVKDMEYHSVSLEDESSEERYMWIGGYWIDPYHYRLLSECDWIDFGYMTFGDVGKLLWINTRYEEVNKHTNKYIQDFEQDNNIQHISRNEKVLSSCKSNNNNPVHGLEDEMVYRNRIGFAKLLTVEGYGVGCRELSILKSLNWDSVRYDSLDNIIKIRINQEKFCEIKKEGVDFSDCEGNVIEQEDMTPDQIFNEFLILQLKEFDETFKERNRIRAVKTATNYFFSQNLPMFKEGQHFLGGIYGKGEEVISEYIGCFNFDEGFIYMDEVWLPRNFYNQIKDVLIDDVLFTMDLKLHKEHFLLTDEKVRGYITFYLKIYKNNNQNNEKTTTTDNPGSTLRIND